MTVGDAEKSRGVETEIDAVGERVWESERIRKLRSSRGSNQRCQRAMTTEKGMAESWFVEMIERGREKKGRRSLV